MKSKSDREAAMAAIKKKFGNELKPANEVEDILPEVIPTGSIQLDIKTGIGGYARGRIVEIYGPNASGKTSLTLHAIAEANKLGLRCAFIDAEQALDRGYAEDLGVNLAMMDYHRPSTGEEALEVLEMLSDTSEYALIVVDSVAALVPSKEVEGDMGDSHVGLQARLMGQGMRKLAPKLSESNTAAIFLNQIREKVGVMYGSPETTSGGNSLPFYASFRLRTSPAPGGKKSDIVDPLTGEIMGGKKRIQIVKNKFAGTAKHEIFVNMLANNHMGCGIDRRREIFDLALAAGYIDLEGKTYLFNGEKIGVGKENAFVAMAPEVLEGLQSEIIQYSRLKDPVKDRMLKALEDG